MRFEMGIHVAPAAILTSGVYVRCSDLLNRT